MRCLLLGSGRQGRAVLHDLLGAPEVDFVRVADGDGTRLKELVAASRERRHARSPAVRLEPVELQVGDEARLEQAMRDVDVVIEMLPAELAWLVAHGAVRAGVHLVNCHYPGRLVDLDEAARARGVTLLTECGLDPGIDLLLAARALRSLDRVEGLRSYGAGFPEDSAATGPLRYKVTWALGAVLRSYLREARLLSHGEERVVAARSIFDPCELHELELDGIGRLEAYPNGDAVSYARKLGLGPSLRDTGRYVLRWPGHAAFWRPLIELGLLDETPVPIEGCALPRAELLARLLDPLLQYRDDERDVAVARVELEGERDGRRQRVVWQLVDRRDLGTGLFAMNRTVGFTASIAAQLVGQGLVERRGLASPACDLPVDRVLAELEARGMAVTREEVALPPDEVDRAPG